MNTDVRKSIFSVLITSEVCAGGSVALQSLGNGGLTEVSPLLCQDYVDAFEKLLRLGLKDAQGREMVHVLLDCCLPVCVCVCVYVCVGVCVCVCVFVHVYTCV